MLVAAGAVSRCATLGDGAGYELRAPSSLALPTDGAADSRQGRALMFVQRYRTALATLKTGPSLEACETFRLIAFDGELNDAVKQLASIRTLQACPGDRALALAQIPSWLAEEQARARLAQAQTLGDKKLLATALMEVSPFEKTSRDRARRLEDALKALVESGADSVQAIEIQTKLVELAPRYAKLYPNVGRQPDPLIVAADLRQARRFTEARGLFLSVAADTKRPVADRLRALDGIRMSYKLERDFPAMLEASERWLKFARAKLLQPGLKKRDPVALQSYLDIALQHARAVWTEHRPQEASRLLLETEKKLAPFIAVHESVLVRSRIEEEAGRYESMAKLLGEINVEALPDKASKTKVLWYRAWNLRRLSRWPDVIQALEQVQIHDDSLTALARYKFWLANAYRKQGDGERAQSILADLTETNPFSYYGVLAFRELGRPLPSLHAKTPPPYNPRSRSSLPDRVRVPADWFVALGETAVARKFVDSFPLYSLWKVHGTRGEKEDYLSMLARLEHYLALNRRLDELSEEERKGFLLGRPDLSFPTPYRDTIMREAEQRGVEPSLIYSIIRQESSFNPMARSPADAFGLMQLIPEMASAAKQAAGLDAIEILSHEDLYDPNTNIRLGTAFIRQLLDRHGGRFVPAVAAYNASDAAIRGWMKSRYRGDALEFIEDIPYEETRLYVRLVLRNFVTYKRLLQTADVVFPETTLSLE